VFHAQIPFELKELKADDGLMLFSGYASVYGTLDHVGDVVMRGAFDDTLTNGRKRRLLWQHQMTEPIGVEQSLLSDEKGLFGTWKLSRTTRGLDAYELLKDGAVDSLSIGYQVAEAEYDDAGVRLLKAVDLLEVSLVSIPALDQAIITQVKAEQPADLRIRNLTDILRAVRIDTTALKARRTAEERKLADRVLEALAESESEVKAWTELLAETLHQSEAKAGDGATTEASTDPAANAASASATSAPDLRLRLELARARLRRSGLLERAS